MDVNSFYSFIQGWGDLGGDWADNDGSVGIGSILVFFVGFYFFTQLIKASNDRKERKKIREEQWWNLSLKDQEKLKERERKDKAGRWWR